MDARPAGPGGGLGLAVPAGALATVLPGERVFLRLDRWAVGDAHRDRLRDIAMVAKAYGRFKPHTEERDRWEQLATARDAEKWGDVVATDVATAAGEREKQDEEIPATPWGARGFGR